MKIGTKSGKDLAVKVNNKKEIDNVVDMAVKYGQYKNPTSPDDWKNVVLKLFEYEEEISINFKKNNTLGYSGTNFYLDYPKEYEVITYNEFMNKYSPISKNVKQIKFESIENKINDFLEEKKKRKKRRAPKGFRAYGMWGFGSINNLDNNSDDDNSDDGGNGGGE